MIYLKINDLSPELIEVMIEVEFSMIQNVVRLFLDGAKNVLELGSDRINTFDFAVLKPRVFFYRVQQLNELQLEKKITMKIVLGPD